MNREFLLNILFLVFINLLIKPFFIFGIDLSVQNRVGAEYGLYFALFNLTYIFQILNDFGIQPFNNRNISRYPQLLPKYFPNLFLLKGLLSLLYFFVTMLFAWLLAGYDAHALRLLGILALNQVLIQFILFLRSNVSGLGFYRLDSILSSLDKLLMLATCGAALWMEPFRQHFTIEMFAWAQTLALLVTVLAAYGVFGLVRRRISPRHTGSATSVQRGKIRRPFVVFLFRQSLPYALAILLMTAYTRLDAVLLERLLPDGKIHADVYAGAYRLLDACNMLGYLFASLLLPMFARMLKNGAQSVELRSLLSLSFNMIWAGSITLAAAVLFARADLVHLMMPERASAYRWDTLGILIWTFVPVGATHVLSSLLTAQERLMQMNRFFVAGLVLDIVLNLLLIPEWKAGGSAAATLATQTFIALSMGWLCMQHFGFGPTRQGLLRIAGFTAFVIGGDWLIFDNMPPGGLWAFGAALLCGLVAVFAFGLLDVRKLRRMAG